MEGIRFHASFFKAKFIHESIKGEAEKCVGILTVKPKQAY